MTEYAAAAARTVQARPAADFAPLTDLTAIIGRIEAAIGEETAAIGSDPDFDIKGSNARKSRYLYDLNRAVKGLPGGRMPAEHRERLTRLRSLLAENERAVLAHLNAVNEVAGLIREAIQRAETDGTYSAGEFGARKVA